MGMLMTYLVELGALSSVAAGSTVTTQGSQCLPGSRAIARIFSTDGAFAGSAQIQTSPDGTTWTNVGRALTSAGSDHFNITLSSYVRLNCTARSAGTVRAVVEGEDD